MSNHQARRHIRGTLAYVAAELRQERGVQELRVESRHYPEHLTTAGAKRVGQLTAAVKALQAALAAIPK
jgi:hypothetical protein